MTSHIFRIENGVLALSLVGDADDAAWQTPGGVGVDVITIDAYTTAAGLDLSCQVTSGALTSSPNTTTDTTPATFCAPEQTTTNVGVTSFTLDVSLLPDEDIAAGVSAYLYEHDTDEVYFLLGLDGVNPPKAVGRARAVAAQVGGDPRVTRTVTVSLPVTARPDIEFGNATVSRIVYGSGEAPTEPEAATQAAAKGTKGSTSGSSS
jgi:hypothetical protein